MLSPEYLRECHSLLAPTTPIGRYVARKRDGTGNEKVYPLIPQTDDEKRCYAIAAAKQTELKAKRQAAKANKTKADVLSEVDRKRVDDLIAAARAMRDFPGQADDGAIFMSHTQLRNAIMCHPQERNTAGRVFGGVLMRRALELAYATAYAFGGTEPRLVELERVDFIRPVDVGALLALTSLVTLTRQSRQADQHPIIHVNVQAATWRPQIRESILANTFSFVFALPGAPRNIKTVVPATRSEAELQIKASDSRRST